MVPARFCSRPFEPAFGIGGPHAQTAFGVLLRRARAVPLVRERWETPDQDFIDVDILSAPKNSPQVLILHGLEGCSSSGYVRVLLEKLHRQGWGGLALNFRSCSGEPNRLLRSYHSGEIEDVRFALSRLRERTQGPLFAAGFSLGGNILLRLLAEEGAACPLTGAAVVSAPIDLDRCARHLDGAGFARRFYREHFLRTLKRKALQKVQAHGAATEVRRIRQSKGFRDFDEAVTAPWHGFLDATDYYTQCSSGPHLSRIVTPTLLVFSKDDPLVPFGCLPDTVRSNPQLYCAFTERGGHVGFVGGSVLWPRFWAEEQATAFFLHLLTARESAANRKGAQ